MFFNLPTHRNSKCSSFMQLFHVRGLLRVCHPDLVGLCGMQEISPEVHV